jgi:DNA-binding Lrp family transcriptional regulator
MDDIDKRILTTIQTDLPVEARPFDALAARLGLAPEDLVARVARLVADGTIRRLGPVFDSRRLGYVSTLVAGRIPPDRIEAVAAEVSRLPGVTHNYERQHALNLWFTLTAPSAAALDETLAALRRETGLREFHSLPALAVYKIRVHFDLTDEGPAAESAAPQAGPTATEFSAEQKELVRLIQDGMAAEREPLAAPAARLGWPVERIVEQIRAWLAAGVIRRFGAVVRHQKLGFGANGMSVFRVAAEAVDEAGQRLARYPEVSHCYRRPPLEGFPYNLFAMVHGRTEDEVRATVARMAAETGLADHAVLFSIREFKKVSMRYFLEGP